MRSIPIVAASVVSCVLGVIALGEAADGPVKDLPPARNTLSVKRIIFICDAGDSMVPKIETLRKELAQTIDAMKPEQSFNLMFMRSSGCAQMSDRLEAATEENRQKGRAFVNQFKPGGKTDPIPAVDTAFKERPGLIYLLADHDFPDAKKLLARVRVLNKDQAITINTIAFLGDGDTDTEFMKVMESLARENGGSYKFVKESDLRATR